MTAMDDELIRRYVDGLPDAVGTFTGTFDQGAMEAFLGVVPDLMPIEIDTGDKPNPAALPMTTFTVQLNGHEWELPVDHVDLLGSNRVRVWVRRPQPHGAE